MSVMIKGMELPENCSGCAIRYEMFCPLRHRFIADEGRRKDCPLVPVPPHGRLGDMDAIARKIRRLGDYVDFTKDEIAGWFENGDFETIIPAGGASDEL